MQQNPAKSLKAFKFSVTIGFEIIFQDDETTMQENTWIGYVVSRQKSTAQRMLSPELNRQLNHEIGVTWDHFGAKSIGKPFVVKRSMKESKFGFRFVPQSPGVYFRVQGKFMKQGRLGPWHGTRKRKRGRKS